MHYLSPIPARGQKEHTDKDQRQNTGLALSTAATATVCGVSWADGPEKQPRKKGRDETYLPRDRF